MKRKASVFLTILLMAACLASCGTPSVTEPQTNEALPKAEATKPVTKELLCSSEVWQDKNDITYRLVFNEDGTGFSEKGVLGAPSFTWSLSKNGDIEIEYESSATWIQTEAVTTEDGFMLVGNYSTKEVSFIPALAKPHDIPSGSCPEEFLGDWYQIAQRDGKQVQENEREEYPSISFRSNGTGNTYWISDIYMNFTWCVADDGRFYIKWPNEDRYDLNWYEASVLGDKLTAINRDTGVEKTYVR